MKRAEFVRRMEKLKDDRGWVDPDGPGLCNLIRETFCDDAMFQFQAIYKPERARLYWGVQEDPCPPIYVTPTYLEGPEKRLQQRVLLVLLFEQQCLNYEMYRGWK